MVPLAALWVAGSFQRAFGVVALLLVLAASWVRWLRFTWRIDPDALVIEHGLFERTRRVIPIERIQAVQTVRRIRHRVFGVVGLRVEAIGGSDTEGQLDALTPDVAARAQRALLDAGGAAAPADTAHDGATASPPATPMPPGQSFRSPEPPGTVLARCTPRMLLVAGLTGGRVGVAAAILGLAQQVFGDGLTDLVLSAPQRLGLTLAIVVAVLAAVVVFVVSVIATALSYWDFTVRRDGALLRLQRGLLDERRDTVPLVRVQSVTIEQNVVRRPLGLATLKVVVAGRAGDDDLTSTLLPISGLDEATRLVGAVFAAPGLVAGDLTPMPRRARSRRLTRAAVVTLVVSGIALFVFGLPWGLAGLAAAAVAAPAALGGYRALGWARRDDLMVARSGWLVQRTTVTPVEAAQSVRVSSSPWQRRRDLATLRLEIARTRRGADPRLLDLDRGTAERLLTELAALAPRFVRAGDP